LPQILKRENSALEKSWEIDWGCDNRCLRPYRYGIPQNAITPQKVGEKSLIKQEKY
jgi:hypothetical protein